MKVKISSCVLLLICAFFLISCKESREDKRAEEKRIRENQQLLYKKAIAEKIDGLINQYNGVFLSLEPYGHNPSTYDLQTFLSNHLKNNIIFRAYLEDIVQTEDGNIVEFLCPVTNFYISERRAIVFRLFLPEASIKDLNERRKKYMPELKYMLGPDYYVIATVSSVQTLSNPNIPERKEKDATNTNIYKILVSTGNLVGYEPINIEKNSK